MPYLTTVDSPCYRSLNELMEEFFPISLPYTPVKAALWPYFTFALSVKARAALQLTPADFALFCQHLTALHQALYQWSQEQCPAKEDEGQ